MSHQLPKLKEMIEIFPGKWIEVTKRIKKKAGVRLSARVRSTLDGGGTYRALAEATPHRGVKRKYPRILVDEAVAISRQVGDIAAAKITGVNRWTISERKKILRGPMNRDGFRYTLAQKRALVRLAQDLMNSGTKLSPTGRTIMKWNHGTAFVEAGRRLGLNGHSIQYQWNNNMFTLTDPPTQPSNPPPGPVSPAFR